MRNLLEIKELIKRIYSKNEVFITPILKFLLAMVTFLTINGRLGYMTKINNIAVVLVVSLLCSFLPAGFLIFFAGVFVLLHFYALAVEAALVGFCLFLVMALLFFRFAPKDSLVVVIQPLCFALNVPYVVPIAMGLTGTPASAVSVACGVMVHYTIRTVADSATALNALDVGEAVVRLRMVIDGILGNKAMIVTIAAFVFTVALVYIIRRMSVDHSWTIAMIAGAIINVVILLLGDLIYDTNVSVFGVLFGSLVSVGLAVVLQFFVFSVDYSRTEKVQFEDDEYYYYVKAVPKMTLAAPEKTVKRINTQVGRGAYGNVHQPARNNVTRTAQRPAQRTDNYRTERYREAERSYTRRNAEVEEIDVENIPDDYEEI